MDIVSYVAEFPRVSETVISKDTQLDFGGKGANQAVQARRMGADVVYLGRVGCDAFGQDMLRHLEREGIDLRGVQVSTTAGNGLSAVTVNETGENMIVFGAGANAELTESGVGMSCERVVSGYDAAVVLGQLEVDMRATRAVFRHVKREMGDAALTLLNIAPFPREQSEEFEGLLGETDVVCCNSLELQALQEMWSLQRLCAGFGVGIVVETKGRHGYSLYGNEGEEVLIGGSSPFVSPGDVKDTVGAGDSFIGTLAAQVLAGKTWAEAAHFASIAAGESVLVQGTQKSFPSAAHVEAVMNSGKNLVG